MLKDNAIEIIKTLEEKGKNVFYIIFKEKPSCGMPFCMLWIYVAPIG